MGTVSSRDGRAVRILHVLGQVNPGGGETLVMNAHRQSDRSRVQFDFAVNTQRPGRYDEEIAALGGRPLLTPPSAQRLSTAADELEQ